MKELSKTISVIGCGWMGLPFSQKMIATGWEVKGSTTRVDKIDMLKAVGIDSFLVKFPEMKTIDSRLFEADVLLLNVPPGRSNPEGLSAYVSSIRKILNEAKKVDQIRKVVFISSTSVYSKSEDLIDEKTPTNPETRSGEVLLKAEKEVSMTGIPFVILRFGGLAGPKRHPGRFFAGKEDLPNGKQSVNFLHLEDAIGISKYMVEQPVENEIFNAAAPIHPGKEQFYKRMASLLDLSPPIFSKGSSIVKREIVVNKLLQETDYQFIYPDPMTFKY